MKIKLLILAMMLGLVTRAQITILASDLATGGDTVRYSTSPTSVSQIIIDTATGANRTWNFSNLRPDFQDIASHKSIITLMSEGVYATSFTSSTYGIQNSNMNIGTTTATNVYSFYTRNSSSLTCDGNSFSIPVSPLPIQQTYNGTRDVIYKLPLVYGNVDSSTYTADPVSLLTVSVNSSGKRKNTVDGWGTITTPFGTYQCLRVKSVFTGYDSIFLNSLYLQRRANIYTEYTWLGKGMKIPLLSIKITTGTGATTTIKYKDITRPEIFFPFANFTASKTACAANDAAAPCKLFNTSTHNPNSVLWTITPSTFTFVNGTSATSDTPQVVFTIAGKYTVKMKVKYNAGTDDTTRVDYIDVQEGPKANFGASITGSTNPLTIVNFYDSSTGNPMPTSWKWTFVPNKISFVGGTTSTSQNPKITFDSATNYAVTLKATNAVGSSSITKNFGVFNTGINEIRLTNGTMSIYPNPADDHFVLNLNRNSVERFEVYDITGRAHQLTYSWNDQNSCIVDCSQLNAGIYFIKVYYQNKQTVVKRISVK